MIPSENPLINWLRFCRWMTLGKICLSIGILCFLALFIHGISPSGFLVGRQVITLLITMIITGFLGAMRLSLDEDERYWSKRNARYQKLIDEIEALENEE